MSRWSCSAVQGPVSGKIWASAGAAATVAATNTQSHFTNGTITCSFSAVVTLPSAHRKALRKIGQELRSVLTCPSGGAGLHRRQRRPLREGRPYSFLRHGDFQWPSL